MYEMKAAAGQFPYTRGIHPDMYRERLWTMRQYAGYGTAEATNERYRYLLQQGQTGLSVAFDLPTQLGLDSDHALAAGEVGKVGVAVDSLEDMEVLFRGIPLVERSVSMTINAPAAVILAMYVAAARKQRANLLTVTGTLQNDPLKEYVARGTYIFPPGAAMRLVVDVVEYATRVLPRFNTVSVSGYHMREAGATAVQEVAFTLANAVAYVQAVVERGLSVDAFAGRFSFFFAVHNNFFEEVAKLRAARRVWARLMKQRFGAKDENVCKLRAHAQTGGSTLTAQQPHNNIVRVTLQALAAVLGGVQSLHTNSYDEALNIPAEDAVTVALRTQQIIAHETGVTAVPDPLGGAYYLEMLTDELEAAIWGYIERIDALGGAVKAVESGFYAAEIAASAYQYQCEVEAEQRLIIGVNSYKTVDEQHTLRNVYDVEAERCQATRLMALKRERDSRRVEWCLAKLYKGASAGENVMPLLITCAEAYVTVGEMCGVLKNVFGEYENIDS